MQVSKQLLKLHFEPTQILVTSLKTWKSSLDLIRKGNTFQTLGSCIRKPLVSKETWSDFGISRFSS